MAEACRTLCGNLVNRTKLSKGKNANSMKLDKLLKEFGKLY
jgi:hypothetical protein